MLRHCIFTNDDHKPFLTHLTSHVRWLEEVNLGNHFPRTHHPQRLLSLLKIHSDLHLPKTCDQWHGIRVKLGPCPPRSPYSVKTSRGFTWACGFCLCLGERLCWWLWLCSLFLESLPASKILTRKMQNHPQVGFQHLAPPHWPILNDLELLKVTVMLSELKNKICYT